MPDWPIVRLGELTEQCRDVVRVVPGETYRLLGVRWYGEGPFHRETVTSETSKATRLFAVRPRQFIYNRLFAGRGSFGLVGEGLADTYVSNEFPLFSCDETRLLPEYLRLWFQRASVWSEIEQVSSGTTQSRSRWNEDRFSAYAIPVPSVSVQRRIVDLLGSVDAHIGALVQERDAVRSLRATAIDDHMRCTDALTTLGQLAEVVQGKALPKPKQGVKSGPISWFKIADMTGLGNEFGYTLADTRMTAEEVVALKGALLPIGSVVFPRVGAAVLTEKKRLLEVVGAVDENHLVLLPAESTDPEYLLGLMEWFRLGDLVQTGAVPSLNMGLVRNAVVPMTSPEEQRSLGTVLAALRELARSIGEEIRHGRVLRSTLADGLLSGVVEIASRYDALFTEAV